MYCGFSKAVFIGPERWHVRYDDITQSKWTARITTIADEERDQQVQRNMFTHHRMSVTTASLVRVLGKEESRLT